MELKNVENIIVSLKQYLPFLIIVLSAIVLPYSVFPISHDLKYILVSATASLFFFLKLIFSDTRQKKFRFSIQNFFWLLFIVYVFGSIYWSVNSYHAIYGAFQVLFTFLMFKIFSTIQWDEGNVKRLRITIFIIFLSAILAEFYSFHEIFLPSVFSENKLGFRKILFQNYLLNHNYAGSLIVISLCFLIFKKDTKLSIFNLALLCCGAILIFLSDSALVTIVLLILILLKVKIVFKSNVKFNIGFILIIVFSIIGILSSNKQTLVKLPVIHEFIDENDRIQMWSNSIKLFMESPLIGKGVNNWKVEVGKYGYNNYKHSRSNTDFQRYTHAHNFFFQLIAELGLLGLILVFSFAVWPVIRSSFYLKSCNNLERSSLICLYSFFLLSMIYNVVYNNYNSFRGVVVICALALAIVRKTHKRSLFKLKESYLYFLLLILSLTTMVFFYNVNQSNKLIKEVSKLVQLKKYNQALILNQNVTSFSDKSISFFNQYNIFNGQKNKEAALEAIRVATENDPYNLELNVYYAKKLFHANQIEKALEKALFIQELHSDYFPATIFLAKIYKRKGDLVNFELLYNDFLADLNKMINRKKNHLEIDRLKSNNRKKIMKELKQMKSYKKQLNEFKAELYSK